MKLFGIGWVPLSPKFFIDGLAPFGHFLDDEVTDLYQECKNNGLSKREASPVIAEKLDIAKILKRASKGWDGGYAMAGLLGHGDSFVFRDPAGIRPAYFYEDEEIVVVASERPVIQTSFNVPFATESFAYILLADVKLFATWPSPPLKGADENTICKSLSFRLVPFSFT